MKTVMKKMFCLLLVAVLLVSAVPAAFAAGTTVMCTEHNREAEYDAAESVAATCSQPGKDAYKCKGVPGVGEEDNHYIYETTTVAHTPNRATAKCEKSIACTVCGYVIEEELGHNYVGVVTTQPTCTTDGVKTYTCANDPTHTYPEAIKSTGHSANANGICSVCGICVNCNQASCVCCDKCDGTNNNHAANCPTLLCDKGCGRKNHEGYCCTNCNEYGHQVTSCDKLFETCCGVQKGSAHRTDCYTNCTGERNCTNVNHDPAKNCKHALCDIPDCKLNDGHTGQHEGVICGHNNQCTFWKGHTGNHSYQCPTIGCDKAVGHTGNCSNDPVEIPGDSDLHIFVNLYTADTLVKTTHLKSYEDISSETLIYDFISDHAQELEAELEEDGHYGYSWSGHVYDKDNKGNPVTMKAKVGKGATVHINAYTDQDLIYIYVHNSRSMSNLRIIQLPGKKVGETVTKSEVTNAVAKYFNVSSLAMYSEQGWEDYVDGHSVDAVSSLKVTSDPYFIDVKIAGTAKSTSGTKADSSNPKTGDTIYAPVMVMGASVSALAVLFYLNKKRAY